MRKRWGKYSIISLLMIIVIITTMNTTYAASDLPSSNQDIPSVWAKASIDKAIASNILPDKLQGEYRANITREEFCEIAVGLYEALGGQAVAVQGENPFTDTQNLKVKIASDLGIVKGIGDGKFAPNNAITRQEICVMLYRTLKAAKPANNYSAANNHVFADNAKISDWSREAVGYLYGMEAVSGTGNNMFNPMGYTTREQAIAIAVRIHEKVLSPNSNLTVSRSETSRQAIVLQAKLAELIAQEMGKPYQWGAAGPDSYDCSGLVYYLYGKLGIALPRVSRSQAEVGSYVSRDELMYGDLVFFARDGKNINHVGIYVGNGAFVHAPETGDVVKKTTLVTGYYEASYYTARRIIK